MFDIRLPEDFLIGTANSAFQSEGAWDRDGKSKSICDFYAEKYAGQYTPGYIPGVTKGCRITPLTEDVPDRGCFFYDNYEAYIEDMQKTGQNTFRMSLSWCRIIPTGYGKVNPKGIEFYNKVIDKLLSCGIQPLVDLLHWDLPQCLMEEGGFMNPKFPEWFEAYAKVCFEAFGDRVKLWSTFNESDIAVINGYCAGRFPPYHSGLKDGQLAAHHVILAHYRAVRAYRALEQGGKIGAVNCFTAIYPASCSEADEHAAQRTVNRRFDWFTQPMIKGTYPQKLLRECPEIRDNMPENYQKDLDEWFAPMDFLGVNYYIANQVRYEPDTLTMATGVENFFAQNGPTYTPYPAGLLDVLYYIQSNYNNIETYITENGCALANLNDPEKECDDPERILYLREHLRMCGRAIRSGINLKGYYYWNDADSYEQQDGYRQRFGLTWVDTQTGERRWKKSRYYFSDVCKTHRVN